MAEGRWVGVIICMPDCYITGAEMDLHTNFMCSVIKHETMVRVFRGLCVVEAAAVETPVRPLL